MNEIRNTSPESDHSTVATPTPVIIVGFKRPEPFSEVLNAVLRDHKGPIYVFLDAPRPGYPNEVELCNTVLEIAHRAAMENRQIQINRPSHNLGVAKAIPQAIDWTLSSGHDRFVLLEEDCLPSRDFFSFMQEMLERYKSDARVAMVSGNQFVPTTSRPSNNHSYYFSRYIHIWGWGAWARSWSHYDHDMTALRDPHVMMNISTLFSRREHYRFYLQVWRKQLADAKNTAWASRWLLATLLTRGLCICPSRNLVTNLGFGADGAHTKRANRYQRVQHETLQWPLSHPRFPMEDSRSDDWWFRHMISRRIWSRMRRAIPTSSGR